MYQRLEWSHALPFLEAPMTSGIRVALIAGLAVIASCASTSPREEALSDASTRDLHVILKELRHGEHALRELARDSDADHIAEIAAGVHQEIEARKTRGATTRRQKEELQRWQRIREASAEKDANRKRLQSLERLEELRRRIALTEARIAELKRRN